jgi:hypothetical protein
LFLTDTALVWVPKKQSETGILEKIIYWESRLRRKKASDQNRVGEKVKQRCSSGGFHVVPQELWDTHCNTMSILSSGKVPLWYLLSDKRRRMHNFWTEAASL